MDQLIVFLLWEILEEVPDKDGTYGKGPLKDRYFDVFDRMSGKWQGSRRLSREELKAHNIT